MRARGDAPALHPARIPADRRDGGGRIEAPRGASAVGTQHIAAPRPDPRQPERDRKSTRLNSSHGYISYAVFCLKKKKKKARHSWKKTILNFNYHLQQYSHIFL